MFYHFVLFLCIETLFLCFDLFNLCHFSLHSSPDRSPSQSFSSSSDFIVGKKTPKCWVNVSYPWGAVEVMRFNFLLQFTRPPPPFFFPFHPFLQINPPSVEKTPHFERSIFCLIFSPAINVNMQSVFIKLFVIVSLELTM